MKKILIVDDDEDIVIILKEVLTARGFDVFTHSMSVDVDEHVKFYHPDLILLDILLFGKSGIDICRELKNVYNIPILLFSANAKKGESYAECGADGFIKKPFEIDDLVDAIKQHVS